MNKENEQPNLGCSFLYVYTLLIFRVNRYIVPYGYTSDIQDSQYLNTLDFGGIMT